MSDAAQAHQPEEGRPVMDMIEAIKGQHLDPRGLSTAERQACVSYLCIEGMTVPEIARILQRADRTIRRDRHEIRERNALDHDPRLAAVMAGQLMTEAETAIS